MTINVIAEIGSNWGGDIELAKQHIKKSKDSGATHVKFQMWRATDLYTQSHPNWNEIKKSELTCKHAKEFKKYADKIGIDCFWSVFYPEAVECLEKIGVKYYKIASRTSALLDKNSKDTMIAIAKTKKPVIISMGFGGNKIKIKNIFKNNHKYWLYCISEYPTDINKINFNDTNQSIISNYDACINNNIDLIKNALKKQMANMVRWTESIKTLEDTNTKKILEIGPGKVLSGLISRISKKFDIISVNKVEDLNQFK